jgi:hypothetical protein
LLAVTVYSIAACSLYGVPEMIPVDGSIARPSGRSGDTDQNVTVPVTVGTLFAMGESFVYTAEVVP